jgi:hypothetical protein
MKKTNKKGVKNLPEQIFKIEAEGDTVYIKATFASIARAKLVQMTGDIPSELLHISVVESLPAGEAFFGS